MGRQRLRTLASKCHDELRKRRDATSEETSRPKRVEERPQIQVCMAKSTNDQTREEDDAHWKAVSLQLLGIPVGAICALQQVQHARERSQVHDLAKPITCPVRGKITLKPHRGTQAECVTHRQRLEHAH